MNNEERDVILTMLAEGKLSPGEAGDLLDALQTASGVEMHEGVPVGFSATNAAPSTGSRTAPASLPGQVRIPRPVSAPSAISRTAPVRYLVIQINDGTEEKVNLRIPLGLAAFAGRFIPRSAREQLDRYDVDLGQLVDSFISGHAAGHLIDIQEGDSRVLIAIEAEPSPSPRGHASGTPQEISTSV